MVEKDLEYLELENMNFENIRNMNKLQFRSLIRQRIEEKTLQKLENVKKSHSKVKNVEHGRLFMQKYLQPNSANISKEEAQIIFKLRCQVTEVKSNFRRKYENILCRACKIEEEDQKHLLQCKILNVEVEQLDYQKIYNGTVEEKLKIARKFMTNFKILEQEKD